MLASRRSKRKPSGGIRSSLRSRDKKLYELANPPTETTIALGKEEKRKRYRGRGGNIKVKAVEVKYASVVMPDNKVVKAEIVTVVKNPSNREYSRRNIITKGAEIKVLVGGKEYNAKVTSRPGQDGIVAAKVLA